MTMTVMNMFLQLGRGRKRKNEGKREERYKSVKVKNRIETHKIITMN